MTTYRFSSPLVTPRLLLRRLEDGDAEALFSYRSLPEVAKYQGWDSFDMADAARLIASQAERQPGVPGTWLQLAIVDRESNRIAGDCGLHFIIDDPRLMEIGITLAPAFQHRGCAT